LTPPVHLAQYATGIGLRHRVVRARQRSFPQKKGYGMSRLLVAIPKGNPPVLAGPHGHRAGCVHLWGRRVLVHLTVSFDVKNLVRGVLDQDRRRKGGQG
jgi:hypothetical protein